MSEPPLVARSACAVSGGGGGSGGEGECRSVGRRLGGSSLHRAGPVGRREDAWLSQVPGCLATANSNQISSEQSPTRCSAHRGRSRDDHLPRLLLVCPPTSGLGPLRCPTAEPGRAIVRDCQWPVGSARWLPQGTPGGTTGHPWGYPSPPLGVPQSTPGQFYCPPPELPPEHPQDYPQDTPRGTPVHPRGYPSTPPGSSTVRHRADPTGH